jgi:Fe2+ or Zn2+ uptake regulation protein
MALRAGLYRSLEGKTIGCRVAGHEGTACLCRRLFAGKSRHVTAEMLFEEIKLTQQSISLATIYNTLRQFTEAGLLRALLADATKSFFDTRVVDHHHFYLEDSAQLIDTPNKVIVEKLPKAPEGFAIDSIEVIVRLRRKIKTIAPSSGYVERKSFIRHERGLG